MIGSDIEFPGNRILEILKMPGNIHNVMNPANTKEILRYRFFGTKSERALVFTRDAVERFVVPHWGKIAKHLLTHRNRNARLNEHPHSDSTQSCKACRYPDDKTIGAYERIQ